MEQTPQVEKIIKTHVLWALGAGLLPLPLFDIAAVTAVQIDMLKQLADRYEVDFTKSTGKIFATSLTGGTFARLGASLIKSIPGIGTLFGGVSMSVLSGASTYAIGQVAVNHFEENGNLVDIDFGWAKKKYEDALERGKEVVSEWQEKEAKHQVYESLVQLGELKEKGVLTEEEFEAKKQELLDRL